MCFFFMFNLIIESLENLIECWKEIYLGKDDEKGFLENDV